MRTQSNNSKVGYRNDLQRSLEVTGNVTVR